MVSWYHPWKGEINFPILTSYKSRGLIIKVSKRQVGMIEHFWVVGLKKKVAISIPESLFQAGEWCSFAFRFAYVCECVWVEIWVFVIDFFKFIWSDLYQVMCGVLWVVYVYTFYGVSLFYKVKINYRGHVLKNVNFTFHIMTYDYRLNQVMCGVLWAVCVYEGPCYCTLWCLLF